MKTDRYNMEDLLSDVEHAGRDARRQQELGDIIDRLAADEENRHGFWWWGARVATAACVLFFISTAVRIWFIPTGSDGMVVAEAVAPSVVVPEATDVSAANPASLSSLSSSSSQSMKVGKKKAAPAEEETLPVEEYYVDEAVEVPAVGDDTVAVPIIIEQNVKAAPVAVAQVTAPEPAPTSAEPAPVPVPDDSKPARRRSFFNLFRPAEPSLMEGTTLALLQF